MPNLRIFTLLLSLCLAQSLTAADKDIGLRLADFSAEQGKRRVEAANALMQQLREEGFGDETVFDASMHPDTVTMTVNYYAAEYLIARGDNDQCIAAAEKALPLTTGHPDYTWQSETLNLLMLAHFYKSQYVEALRYGQQNLEIEEQHKDYERMSSTLNTIAGIYLGARQPWQAEQYIMKAIEADNKTEEHVHANAIYGIAGEVFMGIGQYQRALEYTKTALRLEEERGNVGKIAVRQTQLASLFVVMGDTRQAIALLRKAIPVLAEKQLMPSYGISINTLADALRLEGNLDEAARYFKTAYAMFRKTGDLYNQSHSLQGLARVLRNDNPQEAIGYMEHFAALKDTIYYNDMRQMLTNYSAKFRNTELTEQNEAARETNRAIIIAGLIVVGLMLVGLGFLIYAIRLKSRSNQFLLELQATREHFFTNVTHEFRTPLTVILGIGEQIQNAPSPLPQEKLRTAGEMISREGRTLLQLINQLLDLSKVKANVMQPNWRTDNVVAYLKMLMETFYDFAHSQDIELVFAPRENEVVMDFVPDYMQKIVNNLISNAVKFTPQGGHIHVTTRQENGQFVMQVADNGIGIDRQQQAHIFEPFFQAETDSRHAGTGVGLSLVQQIVTSVGGTITVTSSPNKGTVFTITMPLKQGEESWKTLTDEEKSGLLPNLSADSPVQLVDSMANEQSSRERILIVEDNNDVAYYTGNQLKPYYDVFYAPNGRMGLEKAEKLMPDLMITDLMMPEMDGLELCRQVRSSELLGHIPIIIITARSTSDDLINGIKAGADAYLKKPFNAGELKVRVEKLLEQRRRLQEKFLAWRGESDELSRQQVSTDEQMKNGEQTFGLNEAKFIGKLTDIVCSMMGRGQCDVDSVASALCMSQAQLRRKVQAITGKTPVAYILQIRLSNAQRILDKNPELAISEVAFRCGFSDQAHFSHAFQKAFGMSPTQWAKRAKY